MIKSLPLLKNRRIVLAVSGSIAAYKALELLRLLVSMQASVRIIMSQEAEKFVTKLSFEALSTHKVLTDGNEDWTSDLHHIGFARWAEVIIIAPCTANTINKLSNGIADNLLTQTALATKVPKIIAPAMNESMLETPVTQASLKMLVLNAYQVINPVKGPLACGENVNGAMVDPYQIALATAAQLLKDDFYTLRNIVITSGSTKEKIDDVRYLSNFSSGKMAHFLSLAAHLLGANVCLIRTEKAIELPNAIHTIEVQNTEEMQDFLEKSLAVAKTGHHTKASLVEESMPEYINKKPLVFLAAAVSDYKPAFSQTGKLKKELIGKQWNLQLTMNKNIITNINKNGLFTVGFKAEFDDKIAKKNAVKLLEHQKLNAVCLNILGKENNFNQDHTSMHLLSSKQELFFKSDHKLYIAFKILQELKNFKDFRQT